MIRQDYIMRQVAHLAQALARILGLRAASQEAEARSESDAALQRVFGCGPDLIARFSTAQLLESLGVAANTTAAGDTAHLVRLAISLLEAHADLVAARGEAEAAAAFRDHAAAMTAVLDGGSTSSTDDR